MNSLRNALRDWPLSTQNHFELYDCSLSFLWPDSLLASLELAEVGLGGGETPDCVLRD